MSDPINLIPFGELSDGSMGTAYRSDSNRTVAVVIEIKDTLPATGATENFVGRTVFYTVDKKMYTFTDTPSAAWAPVESASVDVGAPAPSVAGASGDLYYSTDTQILYIYVAGQWVGIAGNLGGGIVWRHYTGDGVTATFPTGSTQTPPVEYVQVYVNGAALSPGISNDYYMVGNNVVLNSTPANATKIAIRTLVFQNVVRNSQFSSLRYVANGSTNEFATGAQMVQPGQLTVATDAAVQIPFSGGAAGTYDYKINTQNNSVVSITRSGSTVTVTTAVAHGLLVGATVSIAGAAQTQYNGNFTIASVPTTTTLTYTIGTTPTTPATGTITYGPLVQNDTITFYNESGVATPPVSGTIVHIQTIETIIAQM